MRITFFGPPGSGKGTQAEKVSDHFGLEHISTGVLLREEISSGSELGTIIREIVESGHLVSDEIVNREVFKRIGEIDDYLLDGYPRNLAQARELDRFLEEDGKRLSGAVFLQVPDGEVLRRLTGRLVCDCADGKAPVGSFSEGETCPECGATFVRRSDDSTEVIKNRLHHYHNLTGHLEEYYTGRLLSIDGVGSIDQVFQRIREALQTWA
jgi:adenylate kinase